MPIEIERVKAVFAAAVGAADVASRAALLDNECADDAELRREVDALLEAHDGADGFLKLPAPASAEVTAGTMIGRYRLLEEIGEGGFGVVFMAEQLEPVRRRVALKIVKAGMDTRQVV